MKTIKMVLDEIVKDLYIKKEIHEFISKKEKLDQWNHQCAQIKKCDSIPKNPKSLNNLQNGKLI